MELPPTIDGHLASLPTEPEQRGRAVPAAVKAYLEEVRMHLEFLHGSQSRSRVSAEESGAVSIHSQGVGRRVN